jgi:glycosyltransferase involved in cell wall biosynthesis
MQKKTPLISICIPTYNQVIYLDKTLKSIFIQKGVIFEVIITDDSSTNDVENLVNDYINKGVDIFYHRNSKQLGSPENWNFAISLAKGEYIKIMHHDEWFNFEDSLLKLFEQIKIDKKRVVFSASKSIYKGKETCFRTSVEKVQQFNKEPERIILGNYIGAPSAILFHRDYLIKFDSCLKWLVDIDFYISILKSGTELHYIDEYLYTSIIEDHNITNQCLYDTELNLFEYSYLFNKHLKKQTLRIQIFYFIHILKILRIINKKHFFTLFLRLFKRTFYV